MRPMYFPKRFLIKFKTSSKVTATTIVAGHAEVARQHFERLFEGDGAEIISITDITHQRKYMSINDDCVYGFSFW